MHSKQSRRVTITTLAGRLGLSVCTVNKALYGKPRISAATAQRVRAMAAALGYQPNLMARAMARPALSVGVIHPDAWPSHYGQLIGGVRAKLAELRDFNITSCFAPIRGFKNGAAFSRTVRALVRRGISSLILCLGYYGRRQLDDAWRILAENNTPYVLLGGNDPGAAGRLTCVWHDCERGGRMAAEMLSLMVGSGPVALFVGQLNSMDHGLKLAGFRKEAARSNLRIAGVYETHDDPAQGYPVARRLFEEHPEVTGVYITSENASGIGRFLVARGLAGRVKVVATGISQEVRGLLERGVAHGSLDQNQHLQGMIAMQTLYQHLETGARPPAEILIPPTIVLRNNLDCAGQEGDGR